MKKFYMILLIISLMTVKSFSQLENYLGQFDENDLKNYVKPLVTSLGVSMNSAAYHSADVPALFGFGISLKAMMILIPESQKTFTPNLPSGVPSAEPTSTIFGVQQGKYYIGPNGYYTFPGGFEINTFPMFFPQVSVSMFNTEIMARIIPGLKLGGKDINLYGFGVKHNISHYIPLMPVDVAFQVLYNDFQIKDLMTSTHIGFSLHGSKSFGPVSAYGGFQYETTNFNFKYTIPGDPANPNPALQQKRDVSVDVKGDNGFRFTLGGAFKLAFFVLNADVNFGSQIALTSGLTFQF